MLCNVFQLQKLWTNITTAQGNLPNMFLNALWLKSYEKNLKLHCLNHETNTFLAMQ